MKKITALSLALVLCLFAFSACGKIGRDQPIDYDVEYQKMTQDDITKISSYAPSLSQSEIQKDTQNGFRMKMVYNIAAYSIKLDAVLTNKDGITEMSMVGDFSGEDMRQRYEVYVKDGYEFMVEGADGQRQVDKQQLTDDELKEVADIAAIFDTANLKLSDILTIDFSEIDIDEFKEKGQELFYSVNQGRHYIKVVCDESLILDQLQEELGVPVTLKDFSADAVCVFDGEGFLGMKMDVQSTISLYGVYVDFVIFFELDLVENNTVEFPDYIS